MPSPTTQEFVTENFVSAKRVQATSESAGDASPADKPAEVEAGPLEQFLTRRQQIQIHVLYATVNVRLSGGYVR